MTTDQGPQLGFFQGYDIRPAHPTRMDEMDEDFRRFNEEHPEVWRLFVRFTFDVIRRGFAHYSSKSIVERIRWHTSIDTGDEEFKINNDHTPAYARLFHKTYPEHAGFFRMRRRISEDTPARR